MHLRWSPLKCLLPPPRRRGLAGARRPGLGGWVVGTWSGTGSRGGVGKGLRHPRLEPMPPTLTSPITPLQHPLHGLAPSIPNHPAAGRPHPQPARLGEGHLPPTWRKANLAPTWRRAHLAPPGGEPTWRPGAEPTWRTTGTHLAQSPPGAQPGARPTWHPPGDKSTWPT